MTPKVYVDTDYIGNLEFTINNLEEVNAQLLEACKMALKDMPRLKVYNALKTAIDKAEKEL